jgi:hypothetical protein
MSRKVAGLVKATEIQPAFAGMAFLLLLIILVVSSMTAHFISQAIVLMNQSSQDKYEHGMSWISSQNFNDTITRLEHKGFLCPHETRQFNIVPTKVAVSIILHNTTCSRYEKDNSLYGHHISRLVVNQLQGSFVSISPITPLYE